MGLNIGFVTGEYPPMEGGVGAFTEQLAKTLARDGQQIHVITEKDARPADVQRSLWDLKEPYEQSYGQLHPRVGRWWFSSPSIVAEVVVDYGLQIVNLQYQAAAFSMTVPAVNFLPWRLRDLVPTVVTFHDLRTPYLFPKAGSIRQKVVFHLARSAEGVIVTNQEDHETLLENGVNEERLRWIPIGSNIDVSDTDKAEVSKIRSKLGLKPDDFLLGYFGFINESKGAAQLIRCIQELDHRFHLVFIGAPLGSSDRDNNQAYLERIQSEIRQMGLAQRIHWSGFLETEKVSAYLQACDLMVMPYQDGVSLRRGTLMAILAHGRPLLTTEPQTHQPEFCHGDNVWLVPSGGYATLASGIQFLANNDLQRKRIGLGALKLSERFSWSKIGQQTMRFFQELLEQNEAES